MTTQVSSVVGVWAVEGALVLGIFSVVVLAFGRIRERFADGSKTAIAGSLLAAMNTASEYGFGGVIAALARLPRRCRGPESDPRRAGE